MAVVTKPSTSDFKPNITVSTPKSHETSPKTATSSPKEMVPEPNEIDHRKFLQKFSQMQLMSTTETVRSSSKSSEKSSVLDSAHPIDKIQSRSSKSKQSSPSTSSNTSAQIKESAQLKKFTQQPTPITQSLPLAQINEPRLVKVTFSWKNVFKMSTFYEEFCVGFFIKNFLEKKNHQ